MDTTTLKLMALNALVTAGQGRMTRNQAAWAMRCARRLYFKSRRKKYEAWMRETRTRANYMPEEPKKEFNQWLDNFSYRAWIAMDKGPLDAVSIASYMSNEVASILVSKWIDEAGDVVATMERIVEAERCQDVLRRKYDEQKG